MKENNLPYSYYDYQTGKALNLTARDDYGMKDFQDAMKQLDYVAPVIEYQQFKNVKKAYKNGYIYVESAKEILKDNHSSIIKGTGNATNTVWDNIKITQGVLKNTKIPKSFELTAGGQKFWVHPNGTKHMQEYITRSTATHNMPMNSQTLLSSFHESVESAVNKGITYEKIMNEGNWELIFSKPRSEGLLPVIKHAVYRP